MKRKVCIMVASRANYGRIKSVLHAVKAHPKLELQLIVCASALLYRFGSAIDVIREDGFEPNTLVYMSIEGETPATMAKSTGLAIVELSTIFSTLKPDIVLTVADRYETLANAVTASYMNIPVAHTQGGEISGSIDESVRHAITKLAHIHFPATPQAARILRNLGENPERIFLTGCPSLDIISSINLDLTPEIIKKYGGTGGTIDFSKPYILVMQHPVTTEYGHGKEQILETIHAIDALQMQTIWLWPNIDAGTDELSKAIRNYREQRQPEFVHFYRNFSPEDYIRFLNASSCIVGNSSSGLREAALLGVPCVNVGTRQSGRERAQNVIDVPYDRDKILQAIWTQLNHGRYDSSSLYGSGHAGKKIADVLAAVDLSIVKRLHYDFLQEF